MPLPIAQPQQQPQQQSGPQDPLAALEKQRATLSGQYQSLSKAAAKGRTMAEALAKLEQLGDAISNDDVIKVMGKAVANGAVDAHQMAVILTDMPPQGHALAEWVSQKLATGTQMLQHVDLLKQEAQRQLIGTSLTSMMAHIGRGAAGAQPEATQAEPEAQPQPAPGASGAD